MAERRTFAVLRDHEVAGLLDEAGDSAAGLRMAALVATLYHACPRLGVALGMDAEDVDLTAARMRLRGRRDWDVPLREAPLARLSRRQPSGWPSFVDPEDDHMAGAPTT